MHRTFRNEFDGSFNTDPLHIVRESEIWTWPCGEGFRVSVLADRLEREVGYSDVSIVKYIRICGAQTMRVKASALAEGVASSPTTWWNSLIANFVTTVRSRDAAAGC